MGISFLKLTNLNEARYYFGEVVKQNRSFLAVKSKIGIADTYFIDSDFDRAISLYLDVLSDTHNIQNVSSVYYKLAKSYQKNGQWDKARYYFEKIKERYPKSLESHLAEEALKEGEFYFTVQVGSFTSRDNAENLCKKLKLQGFPVFINEKIVEDIRFYRVRVGKYDKLYKARDIKQQLKEKGLPTKIYP
jgi:pentatricopeptide repeat protein